MNQRIRLILRPPALAGGARATERMVEAEAIGGQVRMGRGAGLDLVLPFPTVSTLHARIFTLDEQWWVEDLESVNGTWVGPRRISSRRPEPLRAGDELRLADVTVVFAGISGSTLAPEGVKPAEVHGTTTIARRLVADLFGAVRPTEVAVLEVTAGPDQGQRLPLPDGGRTYRVGRGATCDLVLRDPDASREHLALERRWDGIFAQDLGSRNGVQVAGRRISEPTRVGDGVEIALGGTRMRLDDPEDRYLRLMENHGEAPAPAEASGGVAAPSASLAPATEGAAPSTAVRRRGTLGANPTVRMATQKLSRPQTKGVALWFALLAGGVLVALVGVALLLFL